MVDEEGMRRFCGGAERRRWREEGVVVVEFGRVSFGARPSRRAAGRDMLVIEDGRGELYFVGV